MKPPFIRQVLMLCQKIILNLSAAFRWLVVVSGGLVSLLGKKGLKYMFAMNQSFNYSFHSFKLKDCHLKTFCS